MTAEDEALAWDSRAGMLSCWASIMCDVSSSGRLMILLNSLFILHEALPSPRLPLAAFCPCALLSCGVCELSSQQAEKGTHAPAPGSAVS